METTNSRDELGEAIEEFRSMVKIEKDFVSLERRITTDLGQSRSRHVALHQKIRAEGVQAIDALLDDPHASVTMISARQQELEAQRIQCEVLSRVLEETRERRKRAAEATAMAVSTLRKQAIDLLEARYGKRRLFSRWNDESEQTYQWRRSLLGQLLALACSDVERGCALLEYFFREKAVFTLHVGRGFHIASDAGMRVISPTEQGGLYQVPSELPYRESFESVLAGRAELVVSMA
ncbi:MAG: hypothetical protein E8D42_01785 [Nitrospira sp.]|nr:MAG: hypothetical protein E8D42_01785 [Nitrospira sp.]